MEKRTRTTLILGILLILAGIYFVLVNAVPGFADLIGITFSWPVIVMLVGAGLLVIGLLTGTPDMAIPAFIVAGIGGILYYQNVSGNWGSWAYMWTLIPGFSSLGMLAAWLLGDRKKQALRNSLDTLGTSLVLFVVFGAFFGAFTNLGPYWPVLLIVAGVLVGARALITGRNDAIIRE
ncbi:MAG: hypothetical protein AAGU17_05600 [Anaerolineaceae bacterium]|jgi:hypothetical protein